MSVAVSDTVRARGRCCLTCTACLPNCCMAMRRVDCRIVSPPRHIFPSGIPAVILRRSSVQTFADHPTAGSWEVPSVAIKDQAIEPSEASGEAPRRRSGAQILVEYLIRQRVPYIVGIPGHGCWNLTDAALHRAEEIRTLQVM